jgi:hypothetical protein
MPDLIWFSIQHKNFTIKCFTNWCKWTDIATHNTESWRFKCSSTVTQHTWCCVTKHRNYLHRRQRPRENPNLKRWGTYIITVETGTRYFWDSNHNCYYINRPHSEVYKDSQWQVVGSKIWQSPSNAHLKTDGSFSPHHRTSTTAFTQGSLCHTISSTFMVK